MRPLKMLTAVAALAALAHAGDYSTWTSYRPVTLSTSGMGLSQAVANIPISVRFKASAHKDMLDSTTQVQADGSDIRVTKADGTTDVPFEIEYLARGPGGALHLWILADNVPANDPSAGSYRVYWGKTGQTSLSSPATVFPTSAGFQAVFHMNDTTATIVNAANSSLNGTATGTSTTTGQSAGSGIVAPKSGRVIRAFGSSTGGESDASAAANYIQITPGPSATLSTHSGPLTMEGWVYSSITNSGNSSQGTKHIIAHGNGATGNKAWLARTAGAEGATGQNHYSTGGPLDLRGPIAPFQEQNHWQYVVAVWNGTTYTTYRQRESDPWNNATISGPTGMVPDSVHYKTRTGTGPVASTNPWFIGAATDSAAGTVARGWQGWMEEVRISTVARDSNYVKLSFLTFRSDTIAGSIHPISIGATESAAVTGPYATWTGHQSIRLNTSATGANVTGNVTNFPVLVRLGTAEAAIIAAANGGNSLRFTKADNTTTLPYQIESWSSTNATIWVKVDSVKGNNNSQYIRMHWGNGSAAAESNAANVFDTANGYVGVWHMNGTTNETDATVNANTATASGAPATAAGVIGSGRALVRASSQYFSVANNASLNWTAPALTLSAWVNATDWDGSSRIFQKGLGTDNNSAQYGMRENSNNQLAIELNGVHTATSSASVPATATWNLVHARYNGTTREVYLNGVQILTSNYTANITTTTAALDIGRRPDGTNFFNGIMDELRVQKTARSADWLKLEFENQKAINSLANIGLPVYTVPGQPSGVTAVADTLKARISWTAPADNGGKPITGYKAMVVGDTAFACETTTTTCTIPDLAFGVTYNVVVRATNEVGGGPNSLASNAVTPQNAVVPYAPLTPSAVVNSGTAVTVSWTAPANNGGTIITSYTVTASPGGMTCVNAGELTCQVTGLTGLTAYSFTITATNNIGTGPASAPVMATTTSIKPGAFVIRMNGARNPYTYRLPAASVAQTQKLSMIISDVQGKRVWERTISPAATKVSELTWNGTTSKGGYVAPGLYMVRIKAEMNGKVIEENYKGIKQ